MAIGLAGVVAVSTAALAWLAGPLLSSISEAVPPALPWPGAAGPAGPADGNGARTLRWTILFLGAAVCRSLAVWARTLSLTHLQEGLARDLRLWIYARALAAGASARLLAGDLGARAAGDVLIVARAVNLGAGQLVTNLTTLLALTIVVAWVEPWLGAIATLGAVAVAALSFRSARHAAARRARGGARRGGRHAPRVAPGAGRSGDRAGGGAAGRAGIGG